MKDKWVINSFDIETYDTKIKLKKSEVIQNNKLLYRIEKIPYLCSAYYNNTHITIYSPECVSTLLSKIFNQMENEEYVDVYIHGLDFDGRLIINEINPNFYNIKILHDDGSMKKLIINSKKTNKTISFIDSLKIFKFSLENLSKSLPNPGFWKLPFPHKLIRENNINNDFLELPKELEEGCLKDNYNNIENMKNESDFGYYGFYRKKTYDQFISNSKGERKFNLKAKVIEYVERDCLATAEIVREYFWKMVQSDKIKDYDLISSSLTASSLSFKIFNNCFYNVKDDPLNLYNDLTDENIKFISRSYRGGRTEVFNNVRLKDNNQEGSFLHFDYPGFYSNLMKEMFPCGRSKFIKKIKIEEVFNRLTNKFIKRGIYKIRFSQNMDIPVLYKDAEEKLLFINGEMEGVYTSDEIEYFLSFSTNKLIDIKEGLIYEKENSMLKEFVNFFEDFKNRDNICKTIGKLNINGLYGRMGMNKKEEVTLTLMKDDANLFLKSFNTFKILNKKIGNLITEYKEMENKIYKNRYNLKFYTLNSNVFNAFIKYLYNTEKELKKFNNILFFYNKFISKHRANKTIASFITSLGRIKIHKAYMSLIKAGLKVCYSDTDSVIAYSPNYKKHLDVNIGEIFFDSNKKDTVIKEAVFCAPKMYGLKYLDDTEVIKIKGGNTNSLNISLNDFEKKFYNNEDIILESHSQSYKAGFHMSTIIMETKSFKVINDNTNLKRDWINDKKLETRAKNIESYNKIYSK